MVTVGTAGTRAGLLFYTFLSVVLCLLDICWSLLSIHSRDACNLLRVTLYRPRIRRNVGPIQLYYRPYHLHFRRAYCEGGSFARPLIYGARVFFYLFRVLLQRHVPFADFNVLRRPLIRLRFGLLLRIFALRSYGICLAFDQLRLVSALVPVGGKGKGRGTSVPRPARFIFGAVRREEVKGRVSTDRNW